MTIQTHHGAPPAATRSRFEEFVHVDTPSGRLEGTLAIPQPAWGAVIFAHGSGSGRYSPRNRFVAEYLHSAGLATLLIDLLTAEEDQADSTTAEFRFDVELLADRLSATTDWLALTTAKHDFRLGYFGASTGAAAALIAAARQPGVAAIVSRGGRPDLAGPALAQVRAATLLIVGGLDTQVIELNRHAYGRLIQFVQTEIRIIPGATHLFEEPGALEQVAQMASEWFLRHLGTAPNVRAP